MQILVAVDGSGHTKRMLSYIAAHDELLGKGHDYTFVTVVTTISPQAARYLDQKTLDDYYREQAEGVLSPVMAFAAQQGWTAHSAPLRGHAATEIAALAERARFDLVVMGTHGHGSIGNLVLGSVATGVLARCGTPVLLAR